MSARKLTAFAPLLGLLAHCTSTAGTPQTYNFNRPTDIALVCLRVPIGPNGAISPVNAEVTPLPLVDCSTSDPGARNLDPEVPGTARRLFGLVTQSDRGELAVVNLHESIMTGIVDNNRQIPGYTFIPVGSYPSSVLVDPRGGASYVANTGESTVTVIDNRKLLGTNDHRLARIDTQAPPYDLAVVRRGDERVFLYVTVPTRGELQVWDVTEPASPRRASVVSLAGSTGGSVVDAGTDAGTDAAVDALPAEGGALDAGVSEAGIFEAGLADGASDAAGSLDGGLAAGRVSPRDVVVGDDGRVYVADAVATIVHVLEPVDEGTTRRLRELAPLRANEPTTTLVVTPSIPTSPITPAFVYALSASDRSLMVLDTSTGARVRVNAVPGRAECSDEAFARDPSRCPRIDPRVAHDRVPLLAPAAALTVVDRDARGTAMVGSRTSNCGAPVSPLPSCTCVNAASAQPGVNCVTTSADQTPTVDILRGVQVVAALRSGQIQVIDVVDPDAICPARRAQSGGAPIDTRVYRHIVRHGGLVADAPGLVSSPQLLLNGVPVPAPTNVGDDYVSDQPEIVPLDADDARTCADANNYCVSIPLVPGATASAGPVRPPIDPLVIADETWSLSYEGVIPGLSFDGVALRADPTNGRRLVLQAPGSAFCSRGALAGDVVVLPGLSNWVKDSTIDAGLQPPIPPGEGSDYPQRTEEFCRSVFGSLTSVCNRDLRVVRADNTALLLEVLPASGCGSTSTLSAEQLRDAYVRCYPENTAVEVRVGGAYAVVGSRSGFLHDVVADGSGQCVRDLTRFPAGRLFEDRGDRSRYVSPAFSVRVRGGRARQDDGSLVYRPTPRGSVFQFRTYGGYSALVLSTSAPVPSALHYECETQRVYLLDQGRNALFEYGAAPIGRDPRVLN